MGQKRRDILKKMGAAGATISATSLAGCGETESNQGGLQATRKVGENLSDERRVSNTLTHLSTTQSYDSARYQANQLAVERVNEVLGVDCEIDPVEVTVLEEREVQEDYDFVTYAWWSEQGGDPDNVINFRFHSEGQRNFGNYSDPEYDEIAEASQVEYDPEARKELVYEAQEMLGELRWESQALYKEMIYPYNTNVVDEDSVVLDGRLFGTWVTWTNLEPGPENDDGTVTTNNWGATNRLNPFNQNTMGNSRNTTPLLLTHDTLIRYNEKYERELWLADEIDAVDETTVKVTIRDDFEFHDGEPVTVDDVLWTFRKVLETEPPAHKSSITDRLDSVEQTGENEVTFNLTEPYAPFTTLTFWRTPILPAHYWEEVLAETGTSEKPWEASFNDDRPIIGSGPFEYDTWQRGEELHLAANKDHPIAPPGIEARIQRPLANGAAQQEALNQGSYGLLDYWFGDNQSMEELVEGEDHLKMESKMDNLREAIWLNTATAPLDDVAFRQAYNAVISGLQPTYIEELHDGYGQRANSPISRLIDFWHNPETPWFDGGNEGAIELLNDAGYRWDAEGNLYYPEGEA